MTKIKIKGTPPSTQSIYRHRGNVVYMTSEGKDYKDMCQWEMKTQFRNKPFTEPLSVIIELYFKDKTRRDVDNFNKLVLDSCTGILWKDDSQIQELTIRKFIDTKYPRVELFVL